MHAHEPHILGQHHRQLVLGDRHCPARFAIDHGDRAAPVTLPADAPVTQAVVHLALSQPFGFQPGDGFLFCFCDLQAVQPFTIDSRPIPGIRFAFPIFWRRYGADNGQTVTDRKVPVALVLSGHGHDGPGAVSHQNVVRQVQRHRLFGERIEQVGAGKHASFVEAAFNRQAVFLGGLPGPLDKLCDRRSMLGADDIRHQRVLRREYRVRHAEGSIRAGREHPHPAALLVQGAL